MCTGVCGAPVSICVTGSRAWRLFVPPCGEERQAVCGFVEPARRVCGRRQRGQSDSWWPQSRAALSCDNNQTWAVRPSAAQHSEAKHRRHFAFKTKINTGLFAGRLPRWRDPGTPAPSRHGSLTFLGTSYCVAKAARRLQVTPAYAQSQRRPPAATRERCAPCIVINGRPGGVSRRRIQSGMWLDTVQFEKWRRRQCLYVFVSRVICWYTRLGMSRNMVCGWHCRA